MMGNLKLVQKFICIKSANKQEARKAAESIYVMSGYKALWNGPYFFEKQGLNLGQSIIHIQDTTELFPEEFTFFNAYAKLNQAHNAYILTISDESELDQFSPEIKAAFEKGMMNFDKLVNHQKNSHDLFELLFFATQG